MRASRSPSPGAKRCTQQANVPGYRAAIRTGLPHATVVVDHSPVVQPADKMPNIVRRRTTATLRGRRGRARDPQWKARRRLLRDREDSWF
ncbi:transposase [Streptomyces sp. NRRL S-813]|uniref:transposase n=1 Tax=Streptomyces sp. NRRL S-813 TaxID=1463919 RepID=UPI0004BEEF62|nr:transposase [Streptomyces sp. NRRL S-813]